MFFFFNVKEKLGDKIPLVLGQSPKRSETLTQGKDAEKRSIKGKFPLTVEDNLFLVVTSSRLQKQFHTPIKQSMMVSCYFLRTQEADAGVLLLAQGQAGPQSKSPGVEENIPRTLPPKELK